MRSYGVQLFDARAMRWGFSSEPDARFGAPRCCPCCSAARRSLNRRRRRRPGPFPGSTVSACRPRARLRWRRRPRPRRPARAIRPRRRQRRAPPHVQRRHRPRVPPRHRRLLRNRLRAPRRRRRRSRFRPRRPAPASSCNPLFLRHPRPCPPLPRRCCRPKPARCPSRFPPKLARRSSSLPSRHLGPHPHPHPPRSGAAPIRSRWPNWRSESSCWLCSGSAGGGATDRCASVKSGGAMPGTKCSRLASGMLRTCRRPFLHRLPYPVHPLRPHPRPHPRHHRARLPRTAARRSKSISCRSAPAPTC